MSGMDIDDMAMPADAPQATATADSPNLRASLTATHCVHESCSQAAVSSFREAFTVHHSPLVAVRKLQSPT